MESAIRLVVKTPNQQFQDVLVECDFGWTVKKLKDYLTNVYPTKPESKLQRLIYSGHLLRDEVQLRDILNKDHKSHTLHIVCPFIPEVNEAVNDIKLDDKQKCKEPWKNDPQFQSDLRRRVPTSNFPNSSFTSQQQRLPMLSWDQYALMMQQYYTMLSQFQRQQYPGSFQNPSSVLQWQSNMMLSSYQSLMSNSGRHGPYPMNATLPANHSREAQATATQDVDETEIGHAVADEHVENQHQEDAEDVARNDGNPAQPLNAGGAMFDDDEENGDGRRDWLDWVYTFLRASVMLSIMYFYSSTVRILMIGLLGLIIYLYQAGWLFFGRRVRGVQAPEDRNLNNVREGEPNRNNDPNEALNGGGHSLPTQNQEANNERTHGIFAVIYTFVSSFFTSLLPQGVQ